MTKIRVFFFFLTLLFVAVVGLFAAWYARGYRFNFKSMTFTPSGLLVLKSDPSGAQIFVDGDLRSATDATITLSPGNYDVSLRKDGYLSWNKRLTIEKEIVTEAQVSLFKQTPSLTPVTFSGSINPTPSDDLSRIAYAVAPSKEPGAEAKVGLWIIETSDLPLGFSRDPRRITDGDFSLASWQFSPDARQLLVSTKTAAYLVDAGTFTTQSALVNVVLRKETILKEWETLKKTKLTAQIKNLPSDLFEILDKRTSSVVFSPDENKILYTASSEATLKKDLIRGLPGSSTQTQERSLKVGISYVYDIKEDRNFKVGETGQKLHWLPSSRNLVLAEDSKITILDYDGTNRQTVYNGSYSSPHAYPYANTSKLIILSNLGSVEAVSNLYSLLLK